MRKLVLALKLSLFLNVFFIQIGQCQLEFIENQGQWGKEYGLRAKLKHGDLWLAGNKVAFALSDFGADEHKGRGHVHSNPDRAREHHYYMEFPGSLPDVKLKGLDKKSQYHNYYIGAQENWRSEVPLYQVAVHQNLYQGIDMIWKEEKETLKYEFDLKKARNSNQIRIRYTGLTKMQLKGGKLRLETSIGRITEQEPIAFQNRNGKKVAVSCRFKMIDNQTVGFEFPNGYVPDEPLIIDPVLIFSTFSGSRSDNWGFTATYGENGTTYSAGIVLGPRFPRTPGSYQPIYSGDSTFPNLYSTFDIGILKFNSIGTQLLFATYLGGTEAETPASIVVDHNNDLIVLGATSSANFPTTIGAYDRTFNGGVAVSPFGPDESVVKFRQGSDIIVSKFSPNGNQLLGSTFLGGSENDGILTLISQGNSVLVRNYGDAFRGEVAVDSLGKIYIASHTKSTNFPTVTPLQASKSGGFDAICSRFNANLTALEFSTYFGGSGDDGAYSIQVANPTLIYICGGTSSSNFPRVAGGLNSTYKGVADGYVCRFNPSGGIASAKATYVGTSSYDQSYFVQLDRKGLVYLFGQTTGSYPVSPNVYSNPNSSQFIHCLSPNLDSTKFSTVFGNGDNSLPNISPTAFLVDDCGRIYCSGWGGSINNIAGYINGSTTGMPTTADAFSQVTDGSDFYLIAFERNASALSFATFFGNNQSGTEHVDGGTSRFDKKGVVYQAVCAGCGGSSLFPTTPGVYSNTNQASNCNNAVFKYDFSLLNARYVPSQTQACAPATIHFKSNSVYASSYQWDFGVGEPSVVTDLDTITFVFDSAGTYTVKLVAINIDACPARDSITKIITIQKVPSFSGDSLRFCSFSDTLQFPTLPAGPFTYSWQPPTFLNFANSATTNVINPQNSVVYTATVSSSFGCKESANFKLSNGVLLAKAKADTTKGCFPFTVQMTNQSIQGKEYTWFWGDGDSTVSDSTSIPHTFSQPGVYWIKLLAKNDTTCLTESWDSLRIDVLASPLAVDTLIRFCTDSSLVLVPGANEGVRYFWSPGNLLNDSTLSNPIFINPENRVFQLLVESEFNCRTSTNVTVRDGRLKAAFDLGVSDVCVPVSLNLTNTSTNAQQSLWLWESDSTLVSGNGTIPFLVNQPGRLKIRLKVFSDTACQNLDETEVIADFGGFVDIPKVTKFFCPGDSVRLTAFSGPDYQYAWPGFVQVGILPNQGTLLGLDSLKFSIQITDTLQCVGNQNFEVFPSVPNANFTIENQFNLCTDELRYRFVAVDSQLDAYFWKFLGSEKTGAVTSYSFPQRGVFPVKLTVNRDGCLDSTSQLLDVKDAPLVLESKFNWTEKWNNCLEFPEFILENKSIGAERYVWVFGADSLVGPQTSITPKAEGDFKLTLKAYQNGCLATFVQQTNVRKLTPPNLITINGDGKNESFQILHLPTGTGIEIKNRWGISIFSSDNYQNDWKPDGSEGTVFYRLKLPEGNSCNGWIQMVK